MLSSKCSAQPQISKKCSDLKFNFTFTNFQNRLLYIQPVKKTKKVPVKYNSYAWTKTKVRTPDCHFIEKINFQLHKKRHTPIREKFTILPIKNVTARQKNVKSWFNIFSPLKKSIIALKMVFTDTFNFQKKTTPLRFKQISE